VEAKIIESIFTVNLGVKKDERVLVFTDIPGEGEKITDEDRAKRDDLRAIAKSVAETGRGLCAAEYLEFPSVGEHGSEPPAEVWSAAFGEKAVQELKAKGILDSLLRKEASEEELKAAEDILRSYASDAVDAVIALSNYSTSHTNFRRWLNELAGTRYASMPLFERSMLTGVMTADWEAIKERTDKLSAILKGAEKAHILAPNGTDIRFSIEGRDARADTGIIREKGSFSNLPAGEAFLAPVEGTAEGTLVLEWSPTRKLESPVALEVKKGRVVCVAGNDPYGEVILDALRRSRDVGNIAEFGIGTNDKAERPDNILETEKILGSVHVAIGDNSSFGGTVSVPYHQDFIFFKTSVDIQKGKDNILILDEGRPEF